MKRPRNILTTSSRMFLLSVRTRLYFFPLITSYIFFNINLLQYGEIEEMNVCDNLGDHLVGNVYIKVITLFLIN